MDNDTLRPRRQLVLVVMMPKGIMPSIDARVDTYEDEQLTITREELAEMLMAMANNLMPGEGRVS